jgi:hypothetical protein
VTRLAIPAMWRHLPELAAACGLVVLVGCSDDVTPIVWPSPYLPRTSPANLLHNLQKAYEQRNIAEYDSLLAKDFIFMISREDQQNPHFDDSWGKGEEVLIHTRMFDAEMVQTLTVAFVGAAAVWDPADSMYTVVISNVNLLLYGSTPAHPIDVKEYRVVNGRAKFWFRKNGWAASPKPDSIWTIVKWEDDAFARRAGGHPPVSEEQSWGSIKALFL